MEDEEFRELSQAEMQSLYMVNAGSTQQDLEFDKSLKLFALIESLTNYVIHWRPLNQTSNLVLEPEPPQLACVSKKPKRQEDLQLGNRQDADLMRYIKQY